MYRDLEAFLRYVTLIAVRFYLLTTLHHCLEYTNFLFSSCSISLQQAEITGEVPTWTIQFVTAVVHSASYPPGKACSWGKRIE